MSVVSGLKLVPRNPFGDSCLHLIRTRSKSQRAGLVLMGTEMPKATARPPFCPRRMWAVRDGQASKQPPTHTFVHFRHSQRAVMRAKDVPGNKVRAQEGKLKEPITDRDWVATEKANQGVKASRNGGSSQFLLNRLRYLLMISSCCAFSIFPSLSVTHFIRTLY